MKATLFVIAILLGVLLLPVGLLYSVLYRIAFTPYTTAKVSDYFYTCSLAIDQLGNVFCSDLFNTFLIHGSSPVMFGDPDQTISAVLGYAQHSDSLTSLGDIMVNFLDAIDEDHCKKAMELDMKTAK